MSISVDSGLKKKIQIENRKNRRGIYYLWLFEKISFALVIAYAILFPIYCIVTGNLVSTNMRTGKLSYFLVASETSIYTSMGLTAVLLIYVLRMRLEHTFIGGRIDEMIEIVDDKLFYIFLVDLIDLADQIFSNFRTILIINRLCRVFECLTFLISQCDYDVRSVISDLFFKFSLIACR